MNIKLGSTDYRLIIFNSLMTEPQVRNTEFDHACVELVTQLLYLITRVHRFHVKLTTGLITYPRRKYITIECENSITNPLKVYLLMRYNCWL